jgi:hypothetical protein
MEVSWEDKTRWFRESPEWKKEAASAFGLEKLNWRLNRDNQEWADGPVEIVITDEDTSSEEESEAELPQSESADILSSVQQTTETLEPDSPPLDQRVLTQTPPDPQPSTPLTSEDPPNGNEARPGEALSEKSENRWNFTLQLMGRDFPIHCNSESEIWSQLKAQTEVRGTLRLVTDEGEDISFRNLKEDGHYLARYVNKRVYAHIAEDEYESQKMSISIKWNGETKEFLRPSPGSGIGATFFGGAVPGALVHLGIFLVERFLAPAKCLLWSSVISSSLSEFAGVGGRVEVEL